MSVAKKINQKKSELKKKMGPGWRILYINHLDTLGVMMLG